MAFRFPTLVHQTPTILRRMSTTIRHRPPFPSGWASLEISPSDLTLANTLPVGQSFLWHRRQLTPDCPDPTGSSSDALLKMEAHADHPTEEFSRANRSPSRVICLRQTSSRIYYTALHPDASLDTSDQAGKTTQAWLRDYFHLDSYPSLETLYGEWEDRDPGLFGRLELDYEGLSLGEGGRARGVRLLRQDPWECLIAFITSTNNHIPRISGLMHRLSTHFSPPLLTLAHPTPISPSIPLETPCPDAEENTFQTTTYHLFPSPHQLPVRLEQTLRDLGFGYRAGFIESTLATLRAELGEGEGEVEKGLDGWRGGDVEVVREKLIALKGVGRKVADCVMLMCLDQLHLIPIDTHLSAIAARHPSFPSRLNNKPMSKTLYNEVQQFLLDKWGPMGGWAQAVMFAADLPETTISKGTGGTPRKIVAGTPGRTSKKGARKVQVEEGEMLTPLRMGKGGIIGAVRGVKLEPELDSVGLVTGSLEQHASSSSGPSDGSIKTESTQAPVTPTRKVGPARTPGSSKRKASSRSGPITEEPFDSKDVFGNHTTAASGLPAGYGFKRTRSATRIELHRQSSGVSVLAEDVKGLDV